MQVILTEEEWNALRAKAGVVDKLIREDRAAVAERVWKLLEPNIQRFTYPGHQGGFLIALKDAINGKS